ncbi:S9 family peptidase [Kitasatospora nipponensis]|uniref:S9 family peptidase n=1 Tax=Kitasatospora nipponensis TaxID=258049 RepID=UPI0031E1886A
MTDAVQAPGFARLAPGRAVETRLVAGRLQAVAWDLTAGRRRVLTRATHGVDLSEIEPGGDWVWWFDADPGGEGRWRRLPFGAVGDGDAGDPGDPGDTGSGEPGGGVALAGLPCGRAYGLAFDRAGTVAALAVGVDGATRCYLTPPAGPARLLGSAPGHLGLADLSPDGRLLALGGRPDGPDAVLLRSADTPPAPEVRLAGGPGRRLWPIEFHPTPTHGPELLLVAGEEDRYTVATWRADRGLRLLPALSFDAQISVGWYGGGRGVLVQHERAGRSRLLVADLDRPGQREVPVPGGTIHDLSCAPDGSLHCLWSRASTPPRLLVLPPGGGGVGGVGGVGALGTEPAAGEREGAGRRSQRWTAQPYGRIHSFVTTPAGHGPWPTLFLLHGGPAAHDRDSYDPRVETLTGRGYAVVRTNYRGSTGYGPRWQHDFGHRVGLAQLADLAAVRAELVADGTARADRVGLCGYSWGGYLALLALGVQPGLWSLGMAAHPIADYPAAYRAGTPALRALDRELFGGSPREVPERYRAASPLSYVDRVRAPVLLVAAEDDERCPVSQLLRYTDRLKELAVPHELVRVAGGHRSRRTADHRAVLAAMLRFAGHAWPAPAPAPAPAALLVRLPHRAPRRDRRRGTNPEPGKEVTPP